MSMKCLCSFFRFQIDKLPNKQFWASLKELRILYLHGNTISSKDCIRKLNGCPKLHLLTMYDTPLSLMKNYRHHVVNRFGGNNCSTWAV